MGQSYNLIGVVIRASIANSWNEAVGEAVGEWDVVDCVEDEDCSQVCVCGKEGIRYCFEIANRENGRRLFPIGNHCIRRFGQRELDYATELYEAKFRLLRALERRERIDLKSNYFSRRLLEHLYKDGCFSPSMYNNRCGREDYQFILNMFNRRTPPTAPQQRKIYALIVTAIKPYLAELLEGKTL